MGQLPSSGPTCHLSRSGLDHREWDDEGDGLGPLGAAAVAGRHDRGCAGFYRWLLPIILLDGSHRWPSVRTLYCVECPSMYAWTRCTRNKHAYIQGHGKLHVANVRPDDAGATVQGR